MKLAEILEFDENIIYLFRRQYFLYDWYGVSCCFPGPGSGPGQDIFPLQGERYRLLLDKGRLGPVQHRYRLQRKMDFVLLKLFLFKLDFKLDSNQTMRRTIV